MASFTNKNGSPMDVDDGSPMEVDVNGDDGSKTDVDDGLSNYLDIHLKRTAEVQLQASLALNDGQLKEFLTTATGQDRLTQQLEKTKNEFKTNIFCASLLDNIHDFREQFDTGIDGLEQLEKVITDNNLMNKPSLYTSCVIHNEDTYLKSLGLERNVNGHWIYDTEKSDNYFLKEYTFINSTADNNWQNPIEVAIEKIFGSVNPNSQASFPYRNIDLVVDTQKGFFDAITDYTHYFNWLDCAATRIDPAGKSNPKTKPILTDLTEKDSNKQNSTNYKVYYNSIQEVLNIPSYENNKFLVNENEEERNTVLFSSNCDITLYTGEKKKAYALIRPDVNTKIHANKKYVVPHTFLQKSNKIQQTILMVKNLLQELKSVFNDFKSFKNEQTKKYQNAKKNTDMHYLMKRFGDAIQALYCVYLQNQNQRQGNIPWLVTYDRPLLGHAIYYKTPVIVYCNQKRETGKRGSGLTIAIHSSVLSQVALAARQRKISDEDDAKKAEKNKTEAEVEGKKQTNNDFIETTFKLIDHISFNVDPQYVISNNETYKNFLKFLYINFYKNKKYEFINSLTLLLNEVHNINEGIDINNHITHQNVIDKKIDKIEKLKNKITNYKVKDNINTRDRVEMVLRGVRTRLGNYKTIVPEYLGRRRYTNIGGKGFLNQTKNKIEKIILGRSDKEYFSNLNSIVDVIDIVISKLEEEKEKQQKERQERQRGGADKRKRNDNEIKYEESNDVQIINVIHNNIFDHYTEIYIFHRINTLIIDNYIKEKIMNEFEQDGQSSNNNNNNNDINTDMKVDFDFDDEVKSGNDTNTNTSNNSSNSSNNNNNNIADDSILPDILTMINAHAIYTNPWVKSIMNDIFIPRNNENKENVGVTKSMDINKENLNYSEELELSKKNIFNENYHFELEPAIVTSDDKDAILLYESLNEHNSNLNIINNTFKQYYSSLHETDKSQLESVIDEDIKDEMIIRREDLNKNYFTDTLMKQKLKNNNNNIELVAEEVADDDAAKFIKCYITIYNNINKIIKEIEELKKDEDSYNIYSSNNVRRKILKMSNTKVNSMLPVTPMFGVTTGGAKKKKKIVKKNKTKKQRRKLKRTRRKKTSLPKSKKKTKKVKKKRRNKTKIKKGGNKKKHKKKVKKKRNKKNKKKKQLFEMSIKELKEYVKNKK